MNHEPQRAPLRARDDVALQQVGDDVILHDAANGRAHVINASAATIWGLADGRSVDAIAAAFAEPYGLPPEAVRGDVDEVLATFDDLGLLR